MKIAGIDNGLKGAVVYIDTVSNTVMFHDTPTINIKRSKDEYDEIRMLEFLTGVRPDIVYLEHAQAMPGQGVVSMFKTGYGFGLWKGILVGLGISHQTVRPLIWQKEFFKGKTGDPKTIAYQVCCSLFPRYANQLKGSRGGLKDGRCDALLIAEYGRRLQGKYVPQ